MVNCGQICTQTTVKWTPADNRKVKYFPLRIWHFADNRRKKYWPNDYKIEPFSFMFNYSPSSKVKTERFAISWKTEHFFTSSIFATFHSFVTRGFRTCWFWTWCPLYNMRHLWDTFTGILSNFTKTIKFIGKSELIKT